MASKWPPWDPFWTQIWPWTLLGSHLGTIDAQTPGERAQRASKGFTRWSGSTPGQPKSGQISPNQPRSAQISSDQIRSAHISPDQLRSAQISSNQLRSAQISPNQPKSAQISSDQLRSAQVSLLPALACACLLLLVLASSCLREAFRGFGHLSRFPFPCHGRLTAPRIPPDQYPRRGKRRGVMRLVGKLLMLLKTPCGDRPPAPRFGSSVWRAARRFRRRKLLVGL